MTLGMHGIDDTNKIMGEISCLIESAGNAAQIYVLTAHPPESTPFGIIKDSSTIAVLSWP